MLQTTSFGSENYLFSRHYPVDSPHENITLKTANHESIQQKGACHALFPESHSEGRDKPACKVDKPLRRTVSVARGSRIQACQQTVHRAPAENPFRLSRRAMRRTVWRLYGFTVMRCTVLFLTVKKNICVICGICGL